MRTVKDIERIRNSKRLVLSSSQLFQHYYVTLIPLIPMGFIIYAEPDIIKGFGIWIFFIVSFAIFLFQRRKLRFKEFKVECTIEDLIEALKRTSSELDWKIENIEGEYLQAYFNDPLNYYGGNLITILPIDKGFIINSVSDPRYRSVPFISIWDKENIKTFVKHLKDVINKMEENKDYLIPEKEWTTKRVITRLILYPFWLLIIGFCIKSIHEPISFRSAGAGWAGIIFGVGYIVIDIKLIIKRKKYERTTRRYN